MKVMFSKGKQALMVAKGHVGVVPNCMPSTPPLPTQEKGYVGVSTGSYNSTYPPWMPLKVPFGALKNSDVQSLPKIY